MASIVGILINSVTYDALAIAAHQILFWISVGLIHGTIRRQTPEGREAAVPAAVA
ncbi:MAG: hypothetical protein ACYC6B_02065 [Thermoleophilia bacterium]